LTRETKFWTKNRKIALGTSIVVVLVLVAGVYALPKTPSLEDQVYNALKDRPGITRSIVKDYVGNCSDVARGLLSDANTQYESVSLFGENYTLHRLLRDAVDGNVTLLKPVVRIPRSINDYSWNQYSIDALHLLGNRIISHPQSALQSTIRGIEEKPRLGKDLTYLSVEPLAGVFEKQPYDKVIRYWPAVKGVCYQTEKLDPLLGGILFYQNGTLRSDARQLINEILDFQFNNDKGVLPMDESIFEWFDENVAYRVLGYSMGMNFYMFTRNGTISDWGNDHSEKQPSIALALYNLRSVLPTISSDCLEINEPSNIKGLEGYDLKKWYDSPLSFPYSSKYALVYYDILKNLKYAGKTLNFIWNFYKPIFERNISWQNGDHSRERLSRETLNYIAPIRASALRIPIYIIDGDDPNLGSGWHGELGGSLTKQERTVVQSYIKANNHGNLVIDEPTQGYCPLWLVTKGVDLDKMPGGVCIEDVHSLITMYKPSL